MLLCGVIILCLCSCSEVPENTVQKIQVGAAYYDHTDTFLKEFIECFKSDLEKEKSDSLEITTMVREAAGSKEIQNEQVEELIDAGCNVLCVNLVDRADPSEIIDMARENNVPLIFFNREPVSEDMTQWDQIYYVGADAKQSGELQGELATEVIKNGGVDRNGDGKIQYVILEGEVDHQDAIIRTESVVETLEKNGIVMEKLSCQIANWNRAQAQNRMKQAIRQFHDQIELVLANNDDMAVGAIDAYETWKDGSKDNYPVFLGVDGTSVGLQAVKDGKMAGTVYNDKEGQADAMAKLCLALCTGEGLESIPFENERYIYLPYLKIDKENVDMFLNRNISNEK